MRRLGLGLLLLLSGCKQYTPPAATLASVPSGTAASVVKCDKNLVSYTLSEASSVTWGLSASGKTGISTKSDASGSLLLTKGLLNQAKGLIDFAAKANTGKPIRDRLFEEVLLAKSSGSPFRFTVNKLIGADARIASGATVEMKLDGLLEMGGRKSSLLLPVTLAEKDGLVLLSGTVAINARESRPALNAMALDDRIKLMESTLDGDLGDTLTLKLDFSMKSSCP